MRKEPLISVIIPTYNREKIIERAINSVINQTYKNWELIIVDDGSTDNTKKVLEPYLKNNKIKYFHNKNKGVSAVRNFGIKKAQGEYIAFLDSDDEFVKEKLRKQLNEMMKLKKQISLSNCSKINENKGVINYDIQQSFLISAMDIVQNRIPLSASLIMLKKEVTNNFLFDEKLPTSNDFDFVLRSLSKYDILFVKHCLTKIHKTLDGNRISADYGKKIVGYKRVLDKTRKNFYFLNENERKTLSKKLLLELGFFSILESDLIGGRKYLNKAFKIRTVCNGIIKYYLIYILSFFPFCLKTAVYLGRKMWKIGIIK